jgi:transposase
MKKRIYRAVKIKKINQETLCELVRRKTIVFGVDVAKVDFVGVLMDKSQKSLVTIKWKNPEESRQVLDLLKSLPAAQIEVAMEPTGTYGDAMRQLFEREGYKVYLVSAKRCHDASEVYDGVPSQHDSKAAAIIAKLHLDGASREWPKKSDYERKLAAKTEIMSLYQNQYLENLNRIEAKLAKFWPELTQRLSLKSITLLALLESYGSPAEVVRKTEEAKALMKKTGRGSLAPEKCQMVIESAKNTIGVSMNAEEREAIQRLAIETMRNRNEMLCAKGEVEIMGSKSAVVTAMSTAVGKSTAAIMMVKVGDPLKFTSTGAYLKGIGLNLKERSSGKHQGLLKITKRGPGEARKVLYMAVLRLIQKDAFFRAWYSRKVARDGGRHKTKAIVALMRKLAAGLWHVAKGNEFDSSRLFDIRRLKLQPVG